MIVVKCFVEMFCFALGVWQGYLLGDKGTTVVRDDRNGEGHAGELCTVDSKVV